MGKMENINAKRERNKEIFNETLMIIQDTPSIKNMNGVSVRESHAISPIKSYDTMGFMEIVIKNHLDDKMCDIKVTRNRTFEAVRKLKEKGVNCDKIAVLNFASATTPGGGVVSGSSSQEESLCRVSTLYNALTAKQVKIYYDMNRHHKDRFYTDWIIYSPEILVFRNDEFEDMSVLPMDDWYHCNVITCPAPNLPDATEEYKIIMRNRIRYILTTAERKGNTHLILGAFGCGAFKNDPEVVSQLFKEVIIDEGFGHLFEYIEFAVYCRQYDTKNNTAFYNTFKPFM